MNSLIKNITNIFGYEKVGEYNGPFLAILAGISLSSLLKSFYIFYNLEI